MPLSVTVSRRRRPPLPVAIVTRGALGVGERVLRVLQQVVDDLPQLRRVADDAAAARRASSRRAMRPSEDS